MTDSMTALHLILVQFICPGDQRVRDSRQHRNVIVYREMEKWHKQEEELSEFGKFSYCRGQSEPVWKIMIFNQRKRNTFRGDIRNLGNKGVQFQSTCNLCRESHKTQVWLCFLVVSFLSMSTCAASPADIKRLPMCLKQLKTYIERSDAMLYAPSVDEIKNHCEELSLKCYMMELIVVLNEEDFKQPNRDCIHHFLKSLDPSSDGCPACESYPLKNITVFMERLYTLLEKMIAQKNM